jgi:hypothetical protein
MKISTYNFSSIGSLDAAMKNLQPCCHDSRAATRSKCHCVPFLDFAVGRTVGEMRPSSESPITSRFKQGLGSYGISVGSFRTLYSNWALLEKQFCPSTYFNSRITSPDLYKSSVCGSAPKIKTASISIRPRPLWTPLCTTLWWNFLHDALIEFLHEASIEFFTRRFHRLFCTTLWSNFLHDALIEFFYTTLWSTFLHDALIDFFTRRFDRIFTRRFDRFLHDALIEFFYTTLRSNILHNAISSKELYENVAHDIKCRSR